MPIDLEQDRLSGQSVGDVDVPPPSPIEEATFRVLESGRIRFFVCPRIEIDAPTSLEDIQRFSFTLAPRNRDRIRRLSVVAKRLPDTHARDKQFVVVDHVTVASAEPSDGLSRSNVTRGRAHLADNRVGSIEVAAGTYAIASHRDHVHFLYELELENGSVSPNLRRQLRIVPRTSYVAAVPRVLKSGARGERLARLDPILLEREGTELVLVTGEERRIAPSIAFVRS